MTHEAVKRGAPRRPHTAAIGNTGATGCNSRA